jgi:predicted DNA-binding transcriptional regulator AlpA
VEKGEESRESLTHHQRLGDVNAAAKVLDVPKSWVYDRTRRNALPADVMVRLGRYVRFDLGRLLEWAKAGCPEK